MLYSAANFEGHDVRKRCKVVVIKVDWSAVAGSRKVIVSAVFFHSFFRSTIKSVRLLQWMAKK